MQVNLVENPEMKATSLQKQKKSNSYLSDTVFKGTVVNRTLPFLHNLMRFMCKNSQTKNLRKSLMLLTCRSLVLHPKLFQ